MRLRNIPRAGSVLAQCPLVIKNETSYKGKWQKEIFSNGNPVHVEIGMGKGQFLLALAERDPHINYIGIERYTSVLLRAVEKLPADRNERQLFNNLRFLCMDATDVTQVFASREISRIYLNFCDPWPKARHARRRLTSQEYFARYAQILTDDGQVEFKTDNQDLFYFSLEELEKSDIWTVAAHTFDLHHDVMLKEGNIMTEYEEKFSSRNNPICKLIARRQSKH